MALTGSPDTSESRVPMGIAFIGGMAVGSLFTLFVVPAVYTFIASEEMGPAQRAASKVTAEIPEGFEETDQTEEPTDSASERELGDPAAAEESEEASDE